MTVDPPSRASTDPTGLSHASRRSLLAPRYWPNWLGLGVLRLLTLLPQPVTNGLGAGLGELYYRLSPKRRRIARVNLRLCFPQWSRAERERCLHATFRLAGQCLFDYGLLWWGTPATLARRVRIEGHEHYRPHVRAGRPVILLTGHFLGLELGAAALQNDGYAGFGLVKPLRNRLMNWYVARGRARFGRDTPLFPRTAGLRPVVRAIRSGLAFYYLPDEDFGPERTVFVPFLGTEAATITALSGLARLTGAVVIPVSTRRLGDGTYVVTIHAALPDFPGDDERMDAARMRAALGEMIAAAPEQYLWTFRYFKTRPGGAPSPYLR
jgi:lipid A biosynthesis lauroyl/palmitoleoyl acyltransferase